MSSSWSTGNKKHNFCFSLKSQEPQLLHVPPFFFPWLRVLPSFATFQPIHPLAPPPPRVHNFLTKNNSGSTGSQVSPANPVAQVASRHTSFMGARLWSEIQLIIPALATILPGSPLI
ncbi:hypothetical protein DY000_02062503 [Brassica cretica]|uniref:Uncharacterized protein n=1 Tax=Brassica cretica TaxID=69181 RepID=A0ABQ7ASV6_BRACR|nr:hypothetical protein DY000_02062503 [Brassica cretica]